jgi:hypothetical protein
MLGDMPGHLEFHKGIASEGAQGGSVTANFEVMAYLKLAAGKISNLCIFNYTYVYSNIHGHFVPKYQI